MELNVFTEQLEQCYNILAQQFVIIKQLKDLTLGSTNQGSAITELNQRLSALDSVKLFKHNLRLTIIEENAARPPFTNDLIVYSKSSEPLTLNNIIDLIVCKKEGSQIYDTNSDESYCVLGLDNITDTLRIIAYTTYDNTSVIYKILAINSDTVTNN